MKRSILILTFAVCTGKVFGQIFTFGGMLTSMKTADITGMKGVGYSLGVGYCNLFAAHAGFDHSVSYQSKTVSNGIKHYKLLENYFRYQVGVGLSGKDGDRSVYFTALWGFLSGTDYLYIHHEYPDGTISFGNETATGIYEALRSLSVVTSFRAGYGLDNGLGMYIGLDLFGRKKKDVFEFHDWHNIKYSYNQVFGGHGQEYYGLNNTGGFKLSLGVYYTLHNID